MIAVLPLAMVLLGQAEVCDATVFAYPGDKLAGGVAPYLGRHVRPSDNGIAHRTLPLGARVLLVNPANGRSARPRVVDRGPFGRRDATGKWYNGAPLYRRALRRGELPPAEGWLACVDMTPRVQRRLRHSGRGPVILVSPPPGSSRVGFE